jgi:hypothetical protein
MHGLPMQTFGLMVMRSSFMAGAKIIGFQWIVTGKIFEMKAA